jgi:hypothetical protein
MKHYRLFVAIAALVLASLACQALTAGRDTDHNNAPSSENGGKRPEASQPAEAPTDSINSDSDSSSTIETDFPLTDDAFNVMDLGNGSILYYTKLSAEDVMQFYRDAYTAKGYTERTVTTVVSDTTFSMVFDGDPSGKAVIIQSVAMGDGSRTITVRLEDV